MAGYLFFLAKGTLGRIDSQAIFLQHKFEDKAKLYHTSCVRREWH